MAKCTALYDTHVKYGGKIVDFAGYELPVQYANGILFEHKKVREEVGLFDVSHMGELYLSGADAYATVSSLVSSDLSALENGRIKYGLLTNEKGGIVDDVLVHKIADGKYYIVVNASNADKDAEFIAARIKGDTHFQNLSDEISQIAVQGPNSKALMTALISEELLPKKYYSFTGKLTFAGAECMISRTGYTGEFGYEIYMANADAAKVYEALMTAGEPYGVAPCGLGARDTLRMEACMPLYGHELNDDFFANELGLDGFVDLNKEFTGRDAIAAHTPAFKRVAFKVTDKGIAREHFDVYDADGGKIGWVTSGTFAPTLGFAAGMARIKADYDSDVFFVDARGRRLAAAIMPIPLYKRK